MNWWQVVGIVGSVTAPLYGLIIFLIHSSYSMNRELGETRKDLEAVNQNIEGLRENVERNTKAIQRIENSLQNIQKSFLWKPESVASVEERMKALVGED